MRNIDQIDFETSNIEFIEFWMQDPFVLRPNQYGRKIIYQPRQYFGRYIERWKAAI